MELKDIDIHFDVRRDTYGKNADPDSASYTLKCYHQLLWSKPLPNGETLNLVMDKGYYLRWKDMYFGSDSIIVSFMHDSYKLRSYIESAIPNFKEYREDYLRKSYTIAGSIIFPQINQSMNQARGCHPRIRDRWDLTLKCIQLYYEGKDSPLHNAISRNKRFFDLFVNFKGYVDFFLLQDCVDENYNVKLWLDTPLFVSNPMPDSSESYKDWINKELDFVEKRGKRIEDYCGIRKVEISNNKVMDNNFKLAIKRIIDEGGLTPIMKDILGLIMEDKMNRIDIDNLLSAKTFAYRDIKLEGLSTIIKYANIILEDGLITEEEMKNITLMKIFLKIQEGDFYAYNEKKQVDSILKEQLKKIFEDGKVDKEEALKMNDLQTLFGLSYDEFQEVVNQVE